MDSTRVPGDGLERFVNDAVACVANCKMRAVIIEKNPHLALFATKVIQPDEEIRYDYGIPDLPWRTVVSVLLRFLADLTFLRIFRVCNNRKLQIPQCHVAC